MKSGDLRAVKGEERKEREKAIEMQEWEMQPSFLSARLAEKT